jgi:hypothetical protein
LEISPSAASAADLFLTVLYPGDPGAAAPESQLIEQDGQAGCRIAVTNQEFTLLFNTADETGGTFNGVPFATAEPDSPE